MRGDEYEWMRARKNKKEQKEKRTTNNKHSSHHTQTQLFNLPPQMLPIPPLIPLSNPIPIYQSILTSSLLTLSYVGGLYISTTTRIGQSQPQPQPRPQSQGQGQGQGQTNDNDDNHCQPLTKDSPSVIRARLKSVVTVTAAACLFTTAWLARKGVVRGQVSRV